MKNQINLPTELVDSNPELMNLMLNSYEEMAIVVTPKKWLFGKSTVSYQFYNRITTNFVEFVEYR